jgi:hypothetical protein
MYMWKPRKHITPAAILFVVARYAAFPMAVLGAFPVSVFLPSSSQWLVMLISVQPAVRTENVLMCMILITRSSAMTDYG